MNKRIIIAAALLAIGTGYARAEEETNELTALRQKVRLQEQQLKGVNKRLDEIEKASAEAPKQTSKSDWAEKITVKGDFRYRYEYREKDGETDKNRQRIRARIGAYAKVNDFTDAGIRLATGKEANSGNQDLGDNFNPKAIYLDLAYLTIEPFDGEAGALTFGKMLFPWKNVTDLIWDGDVNPEGIAHTYSRKLNKTEVFSSIGYFVVDEDDATTHDIGLWTAQLGITQPIGEQLKATAGGSVYYYNNAQEKGLPVDYEIAELFAELGINAGPLPLKLYGNIINNSAISHGNNGFCAGIKFGDAKKGAWEAKVDYRDLDTNAAPSMFADSDFAGGGTGVKGGRIGAKYNIAKNLQLGATLISGRNKTKQDINTALLDLVVKF
jgi:hypothetical protein